VTAPTTYGVRPLAAMPTTASSGPIIARRSLRRCDGIVLGALDRVHERLRTACDVAGPVLGVV